MTANYTHATSAHGCKIRYTFDNRAARIDYPEGSGLDPVEFLSDALRWRRDVNKETGEVLNVAVSGEPTATMQALQAAKAFFLEAEAAAEKAEGDKVAAAVEKAKAKAAAAVEKAKAKAAAANAPKPKK